MIKIKNPILFKDVINSAKKLGENIQISLEGQNLNLYGVNNSQTIFYIVFFKDFDFQNGIKLFQTNTLGVYVKDLKNQLSEITSENEISINIKENKLNLEIVSRDPQIITKSSLNCLDQPLNLKDHLKKLLNLFDDAKIEFKINGKLILEKITSAKSFSEDIFLKIKNQSLILENYSSLGSFKSQIKIINDKFDEFENRYLCDTLSNAFVFSNLNNEIIMKINSEGPLITKTEISDNSYSLIFIPPLAGEI